MFVFGQELSKNMSLLVLVQAGISGKLYERLFLLVKNCIKNHNNSLKKS